MAGDSRSCLLPRYVNCLKTVLKRSCTPFPSICPHPEGLILRNEAFAVEEVKLLPAQRASHLHSAVKAGGGRAVQTPLPVAGGCAAAHGRAETTPLLPTPTGHRACWGGGPVPSPLPGAQVPCARAERDGAGGARETPSCPFFQFVLLGLSFYIFLIFTCLCFLSSMLWQWCSMLMRQCVVQPQAVIFQVISRVLNTRLLLFHLLSSRSGFPLCREGPLAMPGHPELLLCRVPPSGLCEEVGGSAAVGAARWSGLAPPGCWEQRRWSVHGRCGCWWLRGGMWAESCQGNREAAGKSLKIPLFLPLGKLAGPLQKRCSSCRQQATGTKSREGAQISISHTSISWIPAAVLPSRGLSLRAVPGSRNSSSPSGLQKLGLRFGAVLLQLVRWGSAAGGRTVLLHITPSPGDVGEDGVPPSWPPVGVCYTLIAAGF